MPGLRETVLTRADQIKFQVSNTVTKLRAADGVNLGAFDVGSFPRDIAFDGANIWVANVFTHTVSKR